MRLKWIAAVTIGMAAMAATWLWLGVDRTLPPGPAVTTEIATLTPHRAVADAVLPFTGATLNPVGRILRSAPMAPPAIDSSGVAVQPPLLPPWQATVAAGDTLDGLLGQAGLDSVMRAEIALAIAAQFDLAQLRPGHRLGVQKLPNGRPLSVTLKIDDGVRIVTTIDGDPEARTILPKTQIAERAMTVTVDGSIFASLDRAGIPARFAVDLAQMLGGNVNFRRDLKGGETLKLLWQQDTGPDGMRIGSPQLTYAALDLSGARFEIVWRDKGGDNATIYMDGNILRVFAPPVAGARLTSVFGRRKHPVYGNVRMHTGVDFAAPLGTPVYATAPGRVTFVGRRGGYGRVVEIAHGADTMTRYSHLSAFAENLAVGDRVNAGDVIGAVGSSGLATGPNLHYEVRVDGQAVDPMKDDRMAEMTQNENDETAEQKLVLARRQFAGLIEDDPRTGALMTLSTKGDRL